VYLWSQKSYGARLWDDEGIEVFEPLGGAIRLLSSAVRHKCRPSALPDSNLVRRNIWVCCGGLQSLFIRSIRSSPKPPELGPKDSVLLLANIACKPPCFLAFALFLLLAFADSVMLAGAADAAC
jgi:hypothetical protein